MRCAIMMGAVGLFVAAMPSLAQERAAAPAVVPAAATGIVTLIRDTPVVLMATHEIRSDQVTPGTLFKLRVDRPVMAAAGVVVPVGTPAYGEVVAATGSHIMGTNGTMEVRLRYVQLGDARIPIDGEQSSRGAGAGSSRMVILAAGLVGVFHRGNNAKIKAGELLSGFVAEDVTIDLAAMPVRRVEAR